MLKQIRQSLNNHQMALAAVIFILVAAGIAYLIYSYANLSQEREADLERIQELEEERIMLMTELRQAKETVDLFQEEIQDIGATVGNLKKLSETDEELLQKYSKVYFLNENYVPSRLTPIPDKYLLQPERLLYIHKDVWPNLQQLMDEAGAAGHEILIASAYRSFGTQAALKSGYTVTYGSGANTFSADQGYSEHQLGTTVDFTTPENGTNFSQFSDTTEYAWLLENAYKYGFILSYPEGNEYYKFEPWHWRFVGKSLALFLYNEKLDFYDVSQREIDKYLINIFDE